MAGQVRKGDSTAVQVAKVAMRSAANVDLAGTPGAGYRTGGRTSGPGDGAGTDNRGKPGALAIIYLALQGIYRVFGARQIQVSAGLTVEPLDDGETMVLQAHACADPISMSRMR